MDKISHYRQLVQKIISDHAEQSPTHGNIETIPVYDTANDTYLLLDVGWAETGRIYAVILHLSLREGKVWIERDTLEMGVTSALLEAGIVQDDIVLAFYRPERRAMVEFPIG